MPDLSISADSRQLDICRTRWTGALVGEQKQTGNK